MDIQSIGVIIIGLILLGVVWKVITGAIRFVLTLVVIGAVVYFLMPYLNGGAGL